MSRPTAIARPTATGLFSILKAIRTTLAIWAARRRERAMLARLDVHLLHDIGLDRQDAAQECQKPAWRA